MQNALALILAGATVLSSAAAWAMPLMITEQRRIVSIHEQPFDPSDPLPTASVFQKADDLGLFEGSALLEATDLGVFAAASQQSNIGASSIVATGSATASYSEALPYLRSSSQFLIFFTVPESTPYALSGVGSDSATAGFDPAFAPLSVVLATQSSTEPLELGEVVFVAASSPFSTAGILDPGDYLLSVAATILCDSTIPGFNVVDCSPTVDREIALRSYSVAFKLTPEPSTALLLSAGLALLAGRGRDLTGRSESSG